MSQEKLEKILEKVAEVKDIKNYEVRLNESALTGDGFLSESYTGYVKNKDTNEIVYAYIKHMPSSPGPFGIDAYFNENYFYSNIWPELNRFQKEKRVKIPFTNIAEFYCGSVEPGDQYICMENLNIKKFDMWDKSQSIKADMLKQIFESYGKFHALSFAFKEQNIKKYTELVSPLKDMYITFGKEESYLGALQQSFNAAYEGLKEIDTESAIKIKAYAENVRGCYQDVKVYNGQFSALVHGDCWSNNLLFKYRENGIIEEFKFLDFQLCRDSTPIHDLSYFFYSGASGEEFKKLDEYLELYHKSFSAFSIELGSDPEKLLPLNILKAEWKKNSLLGLLMGILLWQVKLTVKDEIKILVAGDDKKNTEIISLVLKRDTFKKNTTDILIHALEYGIL